MTFLVTVSALVVAGMLAFAGVRHTLHPTRLRDEIAAQRVLPAFLQGPIALSVSVFELTLALACALPLVDDASAIGYAAATGLFVSYGTYTAYLVRYRPDAPCGCAGSMAPASVWAVVRAAVLAALAVITFIGEPSLVPITGAGQQSVISLLAAGAIGLTLWHLPHTLALPTVDMPVVSGREGT